MQSKADYLLILSPLSVRYCVIKLVFDADGHGVDFVFRYFNKHMEVVDGIPVEEMLNRSFYEVFKNGDRKWLISYADAALNWVQRTLRDYSPEIDKNLYNRLSLSCLLYKNLRTSIILSSPSSSITTYQTTKFFT